MDKSMEWWAIRRGGGRELVVGTLPLYPVRVAILRAHQEAIGLEAREVDGKTTLVQVREPSGEDLVAIAYACLGASWQSPRVDLPSFRSCGRDVVEYGEQVQTALLEQGWSDEGLIEQSGDVMRAIQQSVYRLMGLVEDETEGFSKAQEPQTP